MKLPGVRGKEMGKMAATLAVDAFVCVLLVSSFSFFFFFFLFVCGTAEVDEKEESTNLRSWRREQSQTG